MEAALYARAHGAWRREARITQGGNIVTSTTGIQLATDNLPPSNNCGSACSFALPSNFLSPGAYNYEMKECKPDNNCGDWIRQPFTVQCPSNTNWNGQSCVSCPADRPNWNPNFIDPVTGARGRCEAPGTPTCTLANPALHTPYSPEPPSPTYTQACCSVGGSTNQYQNVVRY